MSGSQYMGIYPIRLKGRRVSESELITVATEIILI